MQTTKEILVAARAIIANEENWTQGAYAKDKDGSSIGVNCSNAVCFCSIGAIRKITMFPFDAMKVLRNHMEDSIIAFNDGHTHKEVLAAWDEAIASLE